MTDLELQLFNTFLYSNDVLLKRCLVILELSDLLLKTGALGLLVVVVALDLLLNAVELVGKSLPSVLLFHGQHTLEGLLLAAENLGLLFVSVEMLLKRSNGVIQVVELSLKVCGVVRATRSHIGRRYHGLHVEAAGTSRAWLSVALT